MRRSRQVRPDRPSAMEGRVVPSGAALRVAMLRAAEVAARPPADANAILWSPATRADLDAGRTVYEKHTQKNPSGGVRVDYETIVPDGPNAQTMIQKITETETPGVETIVEGIAESGDVVTRHYAYQFPAGSTQVQTNVDRYPGNTETFTEFIVPSDGPSDLVTGQAVTLGRRVTTDKTHFRSDGQTYQEHIVTTTAGATTTQVTTTSAPGGWVRHSVVRAIETQIRSTSPIA